ncbi:hypothetical protein KC573_01410 [candidate division WWE3 bacterium]|uniref:Uncharacterized protein n=1 Tax=candidate division WWE3 bacterium TaxID=2053526 RepID=A0A955LVU4_UNCKA|nr:hypothetical protein [candidate division WWE3 bacterium]
MPQLTTIQIKEKIKQYQQELDDLTTQYNQLVKKGGGGRVIHEDAASEYKFFQRRVLEGKIKLTEEIIAEFQDSLNT